MKKKKNNYCTIYNFEINAINKFKLENSKKLKKIHLLICQQKKLILSIDFLNFKFKFLNSTKNSLLNNKKMKKFEKLLNARKKLAE
jgi:hypothetical protein